MTERWLPVVGWEGIYEVSDQGRVRSVPREAVRRNRYGVEQTFKFKGRVMALRPDPWGRLRVNLRRPGIAVDRKVHQLVLEAFVGPRPEGMLGLHWDDDKSNNRLENLRWGTYSENLHDAVRNGIHKEANKTHCKRGHEFTPENTRVQKGTRSRTCLTCKRDMNRSRLQRQAAAKEGVNA